MCATTNKVQSFIDDQKWIDDAAKAIQPVISKTFSSGGEAGQVAKDLLNGVWLGHPLHPVITDVPVGAWTLAQVLDLASIMRGEDKTLNKASDWALGVGNLAAVGAAITGLADWSDTGGRDRRTGLAHALLNSTGLLLNMASLLLRLRGGERRGGARLLSMTGYTISGLAAYVGGEMVYKRGVAINRNAWVDGPKQFTDLATLDDIKEGRLNRFDLDGNSVVVVRDEAATYAFGAVCSHYGCDLSEGKLDGLTVTCPCHGSQFDVTDGSVIHGPATAPVPSYETRRRKGKLQVRTRQARKAERSEESGTEESSGINVHAV